MKEPARGHGTRSFTLLTPSRLREATEAAAWQAKQGVLTSAFRSAFPRRQDIPPEVAASLQEHSDSFEEMVEIIDTILPGVATTAAPPVEYVAIAFVLRDYISTDQFAALALPCVEVLTTSPRPWPTTLPHAGRTPPRGRRCPSRAS